MKPSASEEKYMLIQSMQKLVNHISQSPIRQRDIFNSLSKNDFFKIFTNLNDQSIALRTISAQLLCTLTYRNDVLKDEIVKLMQISPTPGRICLNRIPQNLFSQPFQLKYCLELMKQPIQRSETDKMCWVIDVSKAQKQVPRMQFINFQKKASNSFPDPKKVLLGFTYFRAGQKKERPTSRIQKSIQRKQQRSTSRSKISTPRNIKLTGYLNNPRNSGMHSSQLSNKQSLSHRSRLQQLQQKQQKVNNKVQQPKKFAQEIEYKQKIVKPAYKSSKQQQLTLKYIKPVKTITQSQPNYMNRNLINRSQIVPENRKKNSDTVSQTMNSSFVVNGYQEKLRYGAYNSAKSDAMRKSVGRQSTYQHYEPFINKNQNPMKYSYIPMSSKQRPSSSIGSHTVPNNTFKNDANEQGLKTLKADHSQSTKSNSHNFILKSIHIDPFTDN